MKTLNTLICPYDPKHIMPSDSFIRHLSRCNAKNKSQFDQCKFNPFHVVKKSLLEEHYRKCPDFKKTEQMFEGDSWDIEEESRIEDFEDKKQQKDNRRGNGRDMKNAVTRATDKLSKKNCDWNSDEEQRNEKKCQDLPDFNISMIEGEMKIKNENSRLEDL